MTRRGQAAAELTETPADATFMQLHPGLLLESPLNPRKHFDARAMDELTESVRAKGIITPLLVRPNGQGAYEIAAGHRRFRAAKAARLETVPAVVRPMDDVTFIEVLVMENDERQDLHPLEEAEGYNVLIRKAGYTVERIAERRGCSVKYVYDRIKLLQLTPKAKELFRENRFTAGHAILLARLKPEDQERALGLDVPHVEGINWTSSGVFEAERGLLFGPEDERTGEELKARSVRELADWIDEHVRFDAREVDAMVHPETAEVMQALEPEAKVVKITHEWRVHESARDEKERTYGNASWKRADGQQDSKTCEYSVTGVVVAGYGRGDAFQVCVEKKKCAVHWKAEMRQAQKVAKAKASGKESRAVDKYAKQRQRQEAENRRKEAERERWKKAAPAILETVAERVRKAPTKATGLLAEVILEELGYRSRRGESVAALVPRGKTADDLVRHAAWLIIADQASDYYWAAENFPKRAKAFGLDVRKILDEVAPVEKPAKVQTTANTKASKSKAGTCRECGCTDDAACPEGCAWMDETETLCSACADDADMAKPAKKRKARRS